MNIAKLTADGKRRVEAVLARAAEDITFRAMLLENPEQALAGSDLDADERALFGPMRRVALEEWGVDVRRFRAFLRDNGTKLAAY